jgi:hypothetical protein
MERFRQRYQNEHRARAGKCRVSIGRNVLLVPPLVDSMQPAYTVVSTITSLGSLSYYGNKENTTSTIRCCINNSFVYLPSILTGQSLMDYAAGQDFAVYRTKPETPKLARTFGRFQPFLLITKDNFVFAFF